MSQQDAVWTEIGMQSGSWAEPVMFWVSAGGHSVRIGPHDDAETETEVEPIDLTPEQAVRLYQVLGAWIASRRIPS